ncbi:MAG: cell division protein ZipA C-terminal FtsZ-binding domain-containing protein [Gammaproteobacteria bacterium]|nr:cell division protein ZipA C-terminal FtsZ-binding domain-containing protein [Gammaproteobacteria bacterium]
MMNLQIALLVIGIVIIAIIAVSALDRDRLTRSFRRLHFSSNGAGGLLNRREPVVQVDTPSPIADPRFLKAEATVPADLPADSDIDPVSDALADIEEVANQPLNLNPGFDPPGTGPEAVRPGERQMSPIEAIDFVVHLPGPGPVRRRAALSVYKQNEYKLDYPRQLYGQRYQTNFWSTLQYDSDVTQYSDLKLAIQLVDARGPIGETELNTFAQVGLKLADALHRPSKFSITFEQAIERGRELTAFCDEHDVIAGVNVVTEAHTPFKGRALLAAMEHEGMTLEAKNIFYKRDNGRLLYCLSNLYKPGNFDPEMWDSFRTPGLTLFMSVPSVAEPTEAFDHMVDTARSVARFLDGQLLDQDRRPLTDKGITAIRAQIHGIDVKMRAFGIAPGSEAALRLFATDL